MMYGGIIGNAKSEADDPVTVPLRDVYTWKDDSQSGKGESFKKIVQNGQIKMTPYSVGTIDTQFFVLTDSEVITRQGYYQQWSPDQLNLDKGYFEWITCKPSFTTKRSDKAPGWVPKDQLVQTETITRQVHHDTLKLKPIICYESSDDLGRLVEELKSDVSVRLRKEWDAATDLVELRSTLSLGKSLLSSVAPTIRNFKTVVENIKRNSKGENLFELNKKITKEWLEFRYGIMPIVYSIKDISKLMKAESKYRTTRATKRITFSNSTVSIPNQECFYTTRTGEIIVSATAKGAFDSPALRKFNGASLNFFNAAWEATKYSLIVDWFTNFGDWLYSHTNASDLYMRSNMCTSVRRKYSEHTYYRKPLAKGGFSDRLIKVVHVDSYDRVPFTQDDIKLTWAVNFSNWKRWLDAYSMSIIPLIKALRKLK